VAGAALLLVLELERDEDVAGGGLELEDQPAVAAERAEEVAGVDHGVVGDRLTADGFQVVDVAAGPEFRGRQDAVAEFVSGPADRAARRTEGSLDGRDIGAADELARPGELRLGRTRPGDGRIIAHADGHQMFSR
jgi:hypothetical protein